MTGEQTEEQTYQPVEEGAPGTTQVPVQDTPEKRGADDPPTPHPVPLSPLPPTCEGTA